MTEDEPKRETSVDSAARFLAMRDAHENPGPHRYRGRPVGSKNKTKPKLFTRVSTETATNVPRALADYQHADPHSLIERALCLVDWQLTAMRDEMLSATGSPDASRRTLELSNSLVRCIESLKKYNDVADELQKVMSPEQLLEAALKKIEGQDLATLKYAIKRLRAHQERLGPIVAAIKPAAVNADDSATAAIASLEGDS